MQVRNLLGLLGIAIAAISVNAAEYFVVPDSAGVMIKKQSSFEWAKVNFRTQVNYGDSIVVEDTKNATLLIGNESSIQLKDNTLLFLGGSANSVELYLERGQMFLKRQMPHELDSITAILHGTRIVPKGTAVAIKYTKQGEPTAAVLRGIVRMQSPRGDTTNVQPGFAGTLDAAGGFKNVKLPPAIISALQSWSGVELEGAPVVAATDSAAKKDTAASSTQATAAVAPAASSVPPVASAKKADSTEQKKSATTGSTPIASSPGAGAGTPPPAKAPDAAAAASDSGKGADQAKTDDAKPEDGAKPAGGISWEISVGSVTVDGKQWTRIAVSPDIPIWKFGICLDLELFLDENKDFSNKGWDPDDLQQTITRKIRYLRFGYEAEPVFVKVGGLSNVTLGYGFIVDRFTNMLHYPDQKQIGVQFYLNNLTPIGLTLQTMTPDVMEFKDGGGIFGARLAVSPLKLMSIPIVKDIAIGATYAMDRNEYSPAKSWKFTGDRRDFNGNGIFDAVYWRTKYPSSLVDTLIAHGDADTSLIIIDTTYRDSTRSFSMIGADIGVPIIKTDLIGLDIYGQAGARADDFTSWGIGAPGVSLRIWMLMARVEYRHITGRFTPGYFGPYYLDERLTRSPVVITKSQSINPVSLNGVFGTLGLDIAGAVTLDGAYQYMMGEGDAKDQRFEASLRLGDVIVSKIPKLKKVEAYFSKTAINSTVMGYDSVTATTSKPRYDGFFDLTPNLYMGYRVGIEISKGATIIWDMRYGCKFENGFDLVPSNEMTLQTAVTF